MVDTVASEERPESEVVTRIVMVEVAFVVGEAQAAQRSASTLLSTRTNRLRFMRPNV